MSKDVRVMADEMSHREIDLCWRCKQCGEVISLFFTSPMLEKLAGAPWAFTTACKSCGSSIMVSVEVSQLVESVSR